MAEITDRNIVRLGFAQLRMLCDPRGHGLLDALERTCLAAVDIPEKIEIALREVDRSTRMSEVTDLRDFYSKKV